MAVSETPQHAGHGKSHPWVSLHLGLLPGHTPGGSASLIPLTSSLQESLETSILSRKFPHAEKLLRHCRYLLAHRFAHVSV